MTDTRHAVTTQREGLLHALMENVARMRLGVSRVVELKCDAVLRVTALLSARRGLLPCATAMSASSC